VAITAPGPRPPHRFWRCCTRWMTISRHPEPCAGPLPSYTGEADSRRSFRPTCLPTVSPADLHPVLGPRSLDPDRSFWSAYAELIWDQTSPTDFCNCTSTCGQPNLDSLILVGTTASTAFLFSTRHALLLRDGDMRRAALRPTVPTPVLVPPGSPGLPNRDADSYAPPLDLRRVRSED